jgi:beta-mannosidase
MNMLRVWGGGIYENDIFYDLCDEYGLLVWQDFMFSSAMYLGDSAFLTGVKAEADENIRRLRNHPSMALWCGYNPLPEKWRQWQHISKHGGGEEHWPIKPEDSTAVFQASERIFTEILPDLVKRLNPGVPYTESAPLTDLSELKSGDQYHGASGWQNAPIENSKHNAGRFRTGYGLQSFPALNTIVHFSDSADWQVDSEVMKAHRRSSIDHDTIRQNLESELPSPRTFPDFLYLNQLFQAEGIKTAIESHRRVRPHTMGSLYWQLNDCWPGVSWSGIDYFGRWKAMHYYAKRAFSDVLVSAVMMDEKIRVFVVSDRIEAFSAMMQFDLVDFSGKVLYTHREAVKIAENSSKRVFQTSLDRIMKKDIRDQSFIRLKLVENGKVLAENHLFFVPFKDLKLQESQIKVEFDSSEHHLTAKLKVSTLSLGVGLSGKTRDLVFDDNYFILYPDTVREIRITGAGTDATEELLKIRSLNDFFTED